ncbi:MAG TPA: hypothetical protein VMM12_06950 [Longimicrobiales bacterium]|nr:hypothetical protein [Longimicrobiales bacterium]
MARTTSGFTAPRCAGEGGYLFDDFEKKECVAIEWRQDFTDVKTIEEALHKPPHGV